MVKQIVCNVVWMVTIFTMQYDLIEAVDYCQLNRFERSMNSTVMQFTKEAVNSEYGVLNEFKSIHCCAKGYRSIEWYVFAQINISNSL